MTPITDDQGLATAGSHHSDPVRLLDLPFALEIDQASNVVNLDLILGAAELAGVGQEPFEQFRPMAPDMGRLVVEGCIHPPDERYGAPLCEE